MTVPSRRVASGKDYVAPRLWALIAGVAFALVPFVLGAPRIATIPAAIAGGVLVIYFGVAYLRDPRRPRSRDPSDDEPPGGWSRQGPYTSG
jgi:uncharacterized membrane protein